MIEWCKGWLQGFHNLVEFIKSKVDLKQGLDEFKGSFEQDEFEKRLI